MAAPSAAQRRPPGYVEPCIPTLVPRPPPRQQWVDEIKHDGYRLIARKTDGRVRLFTRLGYDWTDRYPRIVEAASAIRASSVTIDGKVVCCDANGLSVFEAMHSRQHNDRAFLYAFDLLELDGTDFRQQPSHMHRARLETLLAEPSSRVQYNAHVEGDGQPGSSTPASSTSKASSRSIESTHIDRGAPRRGSRSRTQRLRSGDWGQREGQSGPYLSGQSRLYLPLTKHWTWGQ